MTDPIVRAVSRAAEQYGFRGVDFLAIGAPFAFGVTVALNAARVPAWSSSVATFFGASLLGVALRVARQHTRSTAARVIADFYPIVTIWVLHSQLNPVIDLVSPVLYDSRLAAIDLQLFGGHASLWLQRAQNAWLTELLYLAYASFFFWQITLGVILYKRPGRDFDDYFRMILTFYVLSDLSYVLVPAIGPRFELASMYTVPLEGVWVGTRIRDGLTQVPMLRDCFPSGHTALTLLVLVFALKRKARAFFFIMLPFAMMIIFSTLYCRFHYAIDLVCALPFAGLVFWLARADEDVTHDAR